MAAGITLAVIGAILAFAVRADPSGINLRVAGLILLVAGGVIIWHSRRGSTRERVVTRVQDYTNPHDLRGPVIKGRTDRTTIQDHDQR